MRLVILESPYAGDVERNVAYARACMADCLQRGEAPIASHLLYTQPGVLDDNVPEQRTLGIEAGLAWAKVADAAVFYVDLGMSPGMEAAWERHFQEGVRMEMRRLEGWGWESKPEALPDDVRRLVIAARECSEGSKRFTGEAELEEALEAFDGRVPGDPKTCETCFGVRANTVTECPVCEPAGRRWSVIPPEGNRLERRTREADVARQMARRATRHAPADNPTDAELLVREWGLGE